MLHTQLTFWSSSHSWNSWSTFHQGWASLVAQRGKRLPAMRQTRVWCFGPEDPLEKEMATQCNTLSWKVPWTEEPGRLRYSPFGHGSQRVGHCWATSLSFFSFFHQCCSKSGKNSVISRRQRPLVAALGAYGEDPGFPWEMRWEVPSECRQGTDPARCSINQTHRVAKSQALLSR